MPRLLITPIKTSDMATVAAGGLSSDYSVKVTTGAANGAYVKCTGIDPTRLVFFVVRNSSEISSQGFVYVLSGSTAGKSDFTPGKYSTVNNFTITINKTTNFVDKGSTGDGSFNVQYFTIPETARFLDSNQYLNFNFSTDLSSGSALKYGARIGALYVGK
jgi:hypothetical protein